MSDLGPDLLTKAAALEGALRERAAAAEALRKLPEETDRVFRDAGFYRVLQPKAFGGLELDYGIQVELAAAVARGCPSSGWVLSILACHAWILGMFPEEAQAEIWGKDPGATIATSFAPEGAKISREGSGLRVAGRWKFSSGVDVCNSAILLGIVPKPGGPPDAFLMLLPQRDYRIDDTWYPSGLIATGSNDIVISDAFVPAHRALPIPRTADATQPGGAVHRSHLYRLPLFALFPHNLIGAALGGVEGALQAVIDNLQDRTTSAQVKLREQAAVQMRVAEAQAALDAAWAPLREDHRRINADARAGRSPAMRERLAYRLHIAHAAKLCVEAIERIHPLGGARCLAAAHPLQRAWRDVHAVAQHLGCVWDLHAANYGAVALGLPSPDPRV